MNRTVYHCGYCCPILRTNGGETIVQPTLRRLCPSPWWFSSLKTWDYSPRTGFYAGTTPLSTQPPLSWNSNRGEGVKKIPVLFARYRSSRLFSLPESKVRAGWPLAVPGKIHDELRWGHLSHHQRRACAYSWRWTDMAKSPSTLTVTMLKNNPK
jgi:hypothetical protein